jgi:hypothetical protein
MQQPADQKRTPKQQVIDDFLKSQVSKKSPAGDPNILHPGKYGIERRIINNTTG